MVFRDWVDYVHLARIDGRWVSVNVLWEYKVGKKQAGESAGSGSRTFPAAVVPFLVQGPPLPDLAAGCVH